MNLDAVKAKKVKGDVKAQGERYIARVVAEKRFQCGLCQRVFKTNAQHRKHTANLSCQKKPLVYVCVPCGYSTKIKTHLIRHHQTAKHKKNCPIDSPLHAIDNDGEVVQTNGEVCPDCGVRDFVFCQCDQYDD